MTKTYIAKALQFIGVSKPVGRKYIETQTKASFGRPLNISGVRFDFDLSVGSSRTDVLVHRTRYTKGTTRLLRKLDIS